MYTHENPSFTIQKGLRGPKLYWHVFVMVWSVGLASCTTEVIPTLSDGSFFLGKHFNLHAVSLTFSCTVQRCKIPSKLTRPYGLTFSFRC